jgi:threonine/homoserine/homoserine lactone efflux protein
MAIGILAAFWAVSFLLVISPGMDWAYTISAGMRGRMVLPAVFGLLVGYLIITTIIAVGIGAFVSQNKIVMTIISALGTAYLLWLGINMLLHPSVPQVGKEQDSDSWSRWAIVGVGVSGLNPKGFLLFFALLPQFTDPAASWPIPAQIMALGIVHVLSCSVIYLLVGYCSKAVLQASPCAARIVSRFSGVSMTAIALLLAAEQVMRLHITN